MNIFDQDTLDRFWSKVRKSNEDKCWIWIAYRNKDGYGIFNYKGRIYCAHIFAFMITHDIILSGMEIVIRHSCNNTSCVNPNHLKDGSQKDNVQDMILAGNTKGRNHKGEKHPKAKLTDNDIRKIRQLAWHFNASQISRMPEWKNKISRINISNIINYKIWKHIK